MEPSLYLLPTDESDLGKSFKKLISEIFIKYNGCLIEKVGKEFKALGKFYKCEQEAKEAIDKMSYLVLEVISGTLKKGKKKG